MDTPYLTFAAISTDLAGTIQNRYVGAVIFYTAYAAFLLSIKKLRSDWLYIFAVLAFVVLGFSIRGCASIRF